VVVLLILGLIVLAFVVDCIIAFFSMLIAPETGLSFIQDLNFWNWFWIVVMAQLLTWTASASRSS